MGKLTDLEIRRRIATGKPFSGLSDGLGLTLCWPAGPDGKPRYTSPFWRLRYKVDGKACVVTLSSYKLLGLAEARKLAREKRAEIAVGHDPAMQKRERKAEAKSKRDALAALRTVAQLADEFMRRKVDDKLKRPTETRQRIEMHISRSRLGGLYVTEVRPLHVDELIQGIVAKGHAVLANDILHWLKRIFDYGVVRHYLEVNPASAFTAADAGGEEKSRERALTLDEIAQLFRAMEAADGFSRSNEIAVRLMLLLGVRKMELQAAPWIEFDLNNNVWHLPADRAKNGVAISIPLAPHAVELLRELEALACGSAYVFPSRRNGGRSSGYVSPSALNIALDKLEHGLEHFTPHDFRRTMRSGLSSLGIPPHICERCVNHKIAGVAGVYDRYDYFSERKTAMESWATLLVGLDCQSTKVVPIRRHAVT